MANKVCKQIRVLTLVVNGGIRVSKHPSKTCETFSKLGASQLLEIMYMKFLVQFPPNLQSYCLLLYPYLALYG